MAGYSEPRQGRDNVAHGASHGNGEDQKNVKRRRRDIIDQQATAYVAPSGAEKHYGLLSPTAGAVGHRLAPLTGLEWCLPLSFILILTPMGSLPLPNGARH